MKNGQTDWILESTVREEAAELEASLDRLTAQQLYRTATKLARDGHGSVISYSRKVFIPLTRLCRDVCGYCTFATSPKRVSSAFMTPEEVLSVARSGQAAGCKEALFTLGDKPELRYAAARQALKTFGYSSTNEYLAAMCELVLRETGLLPHINAGVMHAAEIEAFKACSVSQGIMLESASVRLCEPGGAHFGSPDKHPMVRIAMIEDAGRQQVPFTTGILIGIGETRAERLESLLVLRDLHKRHGHIQEVIVQNFRAKPGTRMAGNSEPELDDLMWTAAAARLVLGADANIQVPPNLSYEGYPALLDAGINDWGGISPVTPDHVNPEAPWPQIVALEKASAAAGLQLTERLAVYPSYARQSSRWQHLKLARRVLAEIDSDGFARASSWTVGLDTLPPAPVVSRRGGVSRDSLITRAMRADRLGEREIATLFTARGSAVDEIASAADELRRASSGDVVRYVVNRNINYTNVCTYRCNFCAFSKGKTAESLRGPAYDLATDEIARRTQEAWQRGATEVCMQGGINPRYTGATYLEILRTAKESVSKIHVHAFSPLEVSQGARTLDLSIACYLEKLQKAGLGSLPGTAAEILDDEVRALICPDKLNTQEWLSVVETAHQVGLKTTATIMFGHVESPIHWARHLLHIRDLQARTGGFTEFVPLPFVHMEAPMFLKSGARRGPTWRECVLMHSVSRLVLTPLIQNIQASWVKLSPKGAARMLDCGVNDFGGTLMNESISRAAGTQHGQELPPERMEALIKAAGREPQQRTTLYGQVDTTSREKSLNCEALTAPVFTPFSSRSGAVASLSVESGNS
jgi:FO synthase